MTGAAGAAPGAALQHRYLSQVFAELCAIESPSLHERACGERVRQELAALGLEVVEDGAGEHIGSDCGNLLARIAGGPGAPGPGGDERRSVLLCAHLDTVPLLAAVEPVLHDGFWENANEAILGADNKAAVAVLLALARQVVARGAPVDVELLFTVGEEIALAGSAEFDPSMLRSDYGYVFDHASPIGEVIMDSPCHFRIDATFKGAAAHAGIRPEDGRSAIVAAARAIAAMRHGRIEDEGTVNIGTIAGGSAINVVAERCELTGEVRGLDDRRGEALVAEIVDRIHAAANRPDCDVDVDVSVRRTFSGYKLAPSAAPVRAAEAALRACGHEPVRISSGGGSDANTLIAKGFPTVNLANGTERNHEPGERVADTALEQMLDVALALLDEVAALAPDAAR
ncbi:MAG TPA: M20/M25/M40 family metallo-hydrolase [Solirubrobacteraceae bacterium]|nr:M20/M25/M40 family metallo-hydrolase [Solirubrobacteraceae bacterium]